MKKSKAHVLTLSPLRLFNLSSLTHAAFFMVIALVLARATMLETLRDPFEATPGAEPVPRSFGAGPSVLLDWLAFVPAILVVVSAAFESTFKLRFTPSLWLLLALALWAALSPLWSNDRFVAVVGAAHFVGGVALLWALVQLVQSWQRLRVIAAAAVALLLVLIAYGLIYRFVELPDLQRSIERDWPRIVAQRGWEMGSFMETRFRQKVMSGEMVGFSASPNTLAALLAMLSIVTTGAVIQRVADRDSSWWAIAIAAPLPLAVVVIYYTHSKAAFISPLLAAMCLAGVAVSQPWLARRHTLLFAGCTVLILATAGVVVGYGVTHGNLLNDSLNFRWRYWVGSARLIRHHPLFGVGWNNFGDQYLAFREPIAAEEIKDPHNLLVRVVAELGVVGGALLLGWLATLWWELTRPARDLPQDEPHRISTRTGSSALTTIVWLAVAAMATNALCSVDWGQDPSWIFLELLKRGLYFALIVVAMVLVSFRSTQEQALDDRPARWTLTALLVALGIFLLHNAIDFSLFESGPMWIFMTLAGAAMGLKLTPRDTGQAHTSQAHAAEAPGLAFPVRRIAIAVPVVLVWVIAGLAIVLPVVIAETKAQASDDAIRANDLQRAIELARSAYHALPFSNSDNLFRIARAQMFAGASAEDIRATLREAIRVNPTAGRYYRTLAELETHAPTPDATAVRQAYTKVLELDPNDVGARLDYAQALEKTGSRREALEQYRIVLRTNDLFAPDEPKRLPPAKVRELQDRINRLAVEG